TSPDAAAALVIGDASEPSRITTPPPSGFAGMISTVTLPPDDVVIASAIAPRAVPPATSIHVESDVDGPRVPGATTDLVARIDGLEIARVAHRWTRASEGWRAALDVVPFGEAPFVVRLEAGMSVVDVAIDRRTAPIRVLSHDARPSWAATFTRRALESDARFDVQSRVFSSRV